jgi:hypothetical protein
VVRLLSPRAGALNRRRARVRCRAHIKIETSPVRNRRVTATAKNWSGLYIRIPSKLSVAVCVSTLCPFGGSVVRPAVLRFI